MFIVTELCNRCGICEENCPTGAIKKIDDTIVYCLRCGNCKAVCPTKAIRENRFGGYIVDKARCTGCGMCATVCPVNIITIKDGKAHGICAQCGKCAAHCPTKALVDLSSLRRQDIPRVLFKYVPNLEKEIDEHTPKRLGGPKKKPGLFLDKNLCSLCGRCAGVCPAKAIYFKIEKEVCTGCGHCTEICPVKAIKDGVVDQSRCIHCLRCVRECPANALHVKDFNVEQKGVGESNAELKYCFNCGLCVTACKYDALKVVGGKIRHDPGKCINCGECVKICPAGVRKRYKDIMVGSCVLCGLCVRSCPKKALSIKLRSWDGLVGTVKCIKCGTCERVCPMKAITVDPWKGVYVDLNKCVMCLNCAIHCPTGAIPLDKPLEKKILSGDRWINKDFCIECGLCIEVCPTKAISKNYKINEKKCTRCGACHQICPAGATHIKQVYEDGTIVE